MTANTPPPELVQVGVPVSAVVITPLKAAPLAVSQMIGAPAETIGTGAIDTRMVSVLELHIPELPDVAYSSIIPIEASAWDTLYETGLPEELGEKDPDPLVVHKTPVALLMLALTCIAFASAQIA